nr:MAG TPA: hypothetical protein [Microviridae sp.]
MVFAKSRGRLLPASFTIYSKIVTGNLIIYKQLTHV